MKHWLLILIFVVPTALGQTMYKCIQEDGKVSFQQKQCVDGKGKTKINIPKSDNDGGLRQSEVEVLKQLQNRRKNYNSSNSNKSTGTNPIGWQRPYKDKYGIQHNPDPKEGTRDAQIWNRDSLR